MTIKTGKLILKLRQIEASVTLNGEALENILRMEDRAIGQQMKIQARKGLDNALAHDKVWLNLLIDWFPNGQAPSLTQGFKWLPLISIIADLPGDQERTIEVPNWAIAAIHEKLSHPEFKFIANRAFLLFVNDFLVQTGLSLPEDKKEE